MYFVVPWDYWVKMKKKKKKKEKKIAKYMNYTREWPQISYGT